MPSPFGIRNTNKILTPRGKIQLSPPLTNTPPLPLGISISEHYKLKLLFNKCNNHSLFRVQNKTGVEKLKFPYILRVNSLYSQRSISLCAQPLHSTKILYLPSPACPVKHSYNDRKPSPLSRLNFT